jgi:hypothetical protein
METVGGWRGIGQGVGVFVETVGVGVGGGIYRKLKIIDKWGQAKNVKQTWKEKVHVDYID